MKNENEFVVQCDGVVNRLYEEVHIIADETHTLHKLELVSGDSNLQLVIPQTLYGTLVVARHVRVEYAREDQIILCVEVLK